MKNIKSVLILGGIALLLGGLRTPSLQANEVVKKFPAGGAADVLNNSKEPVGDAGGSIKIKKDCTTLDGKTVFKGEAAYEACLKEKLEKPKK